MSYRKPLVERERALEDAFFRREEDRKRAAQRADGERRAEFEQLAAVLGPGDPALIDPLLDAGLRAENATALVLAPLVALAWEDDRLDAGERTRILQAELDLGVDPDGEDGALVQRWLDHRPSGGLLEAWAAYVETLCQTLQDPDRLCLRDDVVGRCEALSGAIGRALVRGHGPSRSEREMLERIHAAFRRAGDPEREAGDERGGGLDDMLSAFS